MMKNNLERPALAKLLSDIRAGKVDCVIVYKVDRLRQVHRVGRNELGSKQSEERS